MNTTIGYVPEQCDDGSGKVLQSLLLLARRFLSPPDSSIQHRHAWDSDRFMPNVPPRVWRRHSALLSMLIQQAESPESPHGNVISE